MRFVSWPNMMPSSSAPTEIAMSVTIELLPAPAITAGIVKMPVPMMLPITSAVADGNPSARAAPCIGPVPAVLARMAGVPALVVGVVMGTTRLLRDGSTLARAAAPRQGRRTRTYVCFLSHESVRGHGQGSGGY